MDKTLQEQIADYQEMVKNTCQDGRALRYRLEQEGWEIIGSLLELGRVTCAIHPDLWVRLTLSEDIRFEAEDYDNAFAYYTLHRDLSDEEWEQIVELPVL